MFDFFPQKNVKFINFVPLLHPPTTEIQLPGLLFDVQKRLLLRHSGR